VAPVLAKYKQQIKFLVSVKGCTRLKLKMKYTEGAKYLFRKWKNG